MKRLVLTMIILFNFFSLIASKGYEVSFSQPESDTYVLNFSLKDYQIYEITIDGITYSKLQFSSVFTKRKGFAELPFIHAAVQIPAKKNVDLLVTGLDYEEYTLKYPMLPSRGAIYRDQDPSTIPYIIDPVSITDNWYPENLAENTYPYIIKDIRGTNVYVYPFQYNSKQNILRIYKNVKVELIENNTTPVNPLNTDTKKILREMDAIYKSVFINYDISRDDLTIGEYGDILLVCTDRDEAAIEPYIQWKKEKGYNVFKEVVATGTNVKTLIQEQYNQNNDILYVQLVGDWADIKSDTLTSGAPTDPQLGCVVGTDEQPDICIGRLSTNTTGDVTIQVNKIINYEKNPEMGAEWYKTATGIADYNGPDDDNELDNEHNDTIWVNKLNPFTFNSYNAIYGFTAMAFDVTNSVETGTSIINYTGHGSSTSWGTTGFSSSSVANLTNGNKLPWIVSVACYNGEFNTGTCFAEAWLRKEGGGAVMMLAGTTYQEWDPPLRGQDYFMDILIGGYDYDAHPTQNGISTNEQRTTLGTIVFNGLVLMTTESSTPFDWGTAKTWTTFGDPSLQVRTDTPSDLLLSNEIIMAEVPFITTITTALGPVEGAMVTLSQGNEFFTGITDATGYITIMHTLTLGDALMVVTAFNTETIYRNTTVVPSSNPLVIYAKHNINDLQGNNDGLVDYGEFIYLTVELTNVGTENANNVDVILSTEDEFITITDSTENFGNILIGDSVAVTDAFAFETHNDIPDNHLLIFTINETWTSNFLIIAHATVLEFEGFTISDPTGNNNGKLDPGETADLIISINNIGSADAYEVYGELFSDNQFITVNEPSPIYFGDIQKGEAIEKEFSITADENTHPGHVANFEIDLTANLGITESMAFTLVVGITPVLIVDLDPLNHSGPAFRSIIDDLAINYEYTNTFPENPFNYKSLFISLGVYFANYELSSAQGQKLAEYLENGGMIYMEGRETWLDDPQTLIHPMFNINVVEDNWFVLDSIYGIAETFTDGMKFEYYTDNVFLDYVFESDSSAYVIFQSQPVSYGCQVANDAGSYKTIGSSIEFGALLDNDDPSTKKILFKKYLDFFGIEENTSDINENINIYDITASINYPNPFKTQTTIEFFLNSNSKVKLSIYNINGQIITTLINKYLAKGIHKIIWDGNDNSGKNVSEGIYFYKLQSQNFIEANKMILIK